MAASTLPRPIGVTLIHAAVGGDEQQQVSTGIYEERGSVSKTSVSKEKRRIHDKNHTGILLEKWESRDQTKTTAQLN